MAAVKTFVNTRVGSLPTLREVQAADVVIAFTRSISSDGGVTICGAAPQDNWIKSPASPPGAPSFNPTNGLDLRGRDKFFVALVAVGPGCEGTRNQYNAAHEFGHLFGAGHYDPVGGTTPWLLSNSRAYGYTTIPRRKKFGWVTAVGETFPSVCNTTSTCNRLRRYSNFDPLYGSSSRRNAEAIRMTARSVANYMTGVPAGGIADVCSDGIDNDGDGLIDASDPDCANGDESGPPPAPPSNCNALVPPANVFGYLVQQCVQPSWSQYRIHWLHACPTAVSKYEIWYSQPDGVPYIYGWDRTLPLTDAFVTGPESRVRIRACGAAGCSPLSTSSFLALDIC